MVKPVAVICYRYIKGYILFKILWPPIFGLHIIFILGVSETIDDPSFFSHGKFSRAFWDRGTFDLRHSDKGSQPGSWAQTTSRTPADKATFSGGRNAPLPPTPCFPTQNSFHWFIGKNNRIKNNSRFLYGNYIYLRHSDSFVKS